jgi:hypothetical protein
MTLCGFVLSVLASLCAIGILYVLYLVSAKHAAATIATAECWWLPAANCYRFVIRNIPRHANLFGIRYRAWVRRTVPPSEGISVETYLDTDLLDGERLLLPGRQDLPVLCFRLEASGVVLKLVVTDKIGVPAGKEEEIGEDVKSLMVEFSVRARTWGLFKHEITRLYAVPQYREIEGKRRNIFREYLVPIQLSHERQMKSVLQYANEVTVTV